LASARRDAGALAPFVEDYRAWLERHGYTRQTIGNMLTDLGRVGLWLSKHDLDASGLSEDRLAGYLSDRRAAGRKVSGLRGMVPLLTFLRQAGATPAPAETSSPVEAMLARYQLWMAQERDLSAATMLRYENTARRFLAKQAMADGVFAPQCLTGGDLNAFLLRECSRVSAGSAKGRVAELRSLMRFLYLDGVLPRRLGAAVPPVGGWRLAAVPPRIAARDVQLLLDRCPRREDVEIRDYAILMLVARLGLRSIEVAASKWTMCTGARARSWCAARGAARTGCRCLPMSAKLSWPTCARPGRGCRPATCS
jgi:site-specific recombinase XerD